MDTLNGFIVDKLAGILIVAESMMKNWVAFVDDKSAEKIIIFINNISEDEF
jgi:hypothetical protein